MTTSLDSRLWVGVFEEQLGTDIAHSVTNERPDVPIVTITVSDIVSTAAVVAIGNAHNLTVLEM